ncbi:RAD50-interacting protein 1 [Erysiphe neolycopersici]|uniref:RAD50-interacting protein 1 n=1 Tax=Erysiphe neolycopersici TaxID=212602 RepID=A0A420HIC1_9PEZI|nr:RAD50-interacting protein 1 [Erysiphe neolycopersici]
MEVPPRLENFGVEDFLNDKLQNFSDLDTLESLIASVEVQQKHLEEQVHDVQSKLSEAKHASAERNTTMLKRINEFEKHHNSVQRRLKAIIASETPDVALHRLKLPMDKLKKVEIAHGYIEFLNDIESLKNDARKFLPSNYNLALESYRKIMKISSTLQSFQDSNEEAVLNLNLHVQKTAVDLWAEMKKIMCDDFEVLLKRSNWPDLSCTFSKECNEGFKRLLEFQSQEIFTSRKSHILLPMKVITKNLVLEFQYHFSGGKVTNQTHRLGDYFFEWFLTTIAKWEGFLLKNVTHILAIHFKDTSLAADTSYVDPIAAFINSLLPVLQEKVESLTKEILTQPQLLSQFISQLLDFDESLKTKFKYNISNCETAKEDLTSHILEKYFNDWYEVEKKFAFDRYQEIIHAKNSGEIDYDSSPLGKTKSSYESSQVTDLIANITVKYKRLQNFSYKIKFFIGIQAEILDLYLGRLNYALEYYQTANSTVGRTIHGVTKEELEEIKGIKGLDKLCRVFGSADHLINILKEWIYDEFFLVIYDQIQSRAASVDATAKVAGNNLASEVIECTSKVVGSESDGSLFDTTLEAYERQRKRAESLITQAIKYDLPHIFRPYLTKSQWTTVGEVSLLESTSILITPELDLPLQILQTYVQFLHRALADAPFRRIIRGVIKKLQDLLFYELLLNQDFTFLGSVRFFQDITAILSLINCSLSSKSQVPFDMPLLREGALLLSLSDSIEGENDSFSCVSKAIFSTNQEATETLKRLGIAHLSNSEARTVLERRINETEVEKEIF